MEPAYPSYVVRTQADVAAFCGVSPATVKDWTARGMPGETDRYDLASIVPWLRQKGPWRQRGQDDVVEALLDSEAGNDSPALERLRLAKAQMAELDLAERRRELMDITAARKTLDSWAALIAGLGERLSKSYGPAAAGAVGDTLKACERLLDQALEESTPDGDGDGPDDDA